MRRARANMEIKEHRATQKQITQHYILTWYLITDKRDFLNAAYDIW